jgi:NAD(P)H-hydrate repair Nnr-like enzyme with NAD(P)H-hydrate epimerase domain
MLMLKVFRRSFTSLQHKALRRTISGNKLSTEEITVDRSPTVYNNTGLQINNNLDKIYNQNYDAIIVGAGHNGLVCANYLAEKGKKVLILERRHEVGRTCLMKVVLLLLKNL